MASNLAGDICIGQHSTCLLRAATLNPDCSPVGGADGGVVTYGIITATFTPTYTDERRIEPQNGCGRNLFRYVAPGKPTGGTITGEVGFHDWELMEILFGGSLILGKAGGEFAGAVIGHAMPAEDDASPAAVYLEIIVQNAGEGVGECASADDPFPAYTGHIFGKAKLTRDAATFNDAELTLAFTGTVESNPNLVFGPWGDWPGTGVVPNSPWIEASYSQDEWETIAEAAACGYGTLPAAYS